MPEGRSRVSIASWRARGLLTFEEAEIETPQGVTDAGSEVVVSNTTHFRGREGIEVSASSTWVFTVENGQITCIRLFQERDEALEAAGLRE